MAEFSKIMYKDKLTKLDIFGRNHKLFRSLPVHKRALKAGLRVPKIYDIKEKSNKIYKYSEWISGNTIQYEMDNNPNLVEPICIDLARYMNELYDIDNITAVDNHFENFVWNNNQVVYIDLKKLLYRDYDNHILQMSKICLKNCRGDRRKALIFLKEYAKHRDVEQVISDCNNRKWLWKGINGNVVSIDPIELREVLSDKKRV